jgi:hypothetical protein
LPDGRDWRDASIYDKRASDQSLDDVACSSVSGVLRRETDAQNRKQNQLKLLTQKLTISISNASHEPGQAKERERKMRDSAQN